MTFARFAVSTEMTVSCWLVVSRRKTTPLLKPGSCAGDRQDVTDAAAGGHRLVLRRVPSDQDRHEQRVERDQRPEHRRLLRAAHHGLHRGLLCRGAVRAGLARSAGCDRDVTFQVEARQRQE